MLVTHDQSEALLLGDRIAILDRGRLLQCGTPREVYERPMDRFVATFVGSPPMNIVPCELVREEDRTRVHLIAADRSPELGDAGRLGPARLAGVGPGRARSAAGSHRHPPRRRHPDASPWSPVFDAQVRRLEFNGPEILATLSLGPHRVVARLASSFPVQDRQHLRVTLDLKPAVWFDPETGTALP